MERDGAWWLLRARRYEGKDLEVVTVDEDVARQRVRRLRDFYIHVAVYVVVNAGLWLFDWLISPNFWWAAFPSIFWGIGLVVHAVSVVFEDGLFGTSWEERKTRELIERERRHQAG